MALDHRLKLPEDHPVFRLAVAMSDATGPAANPPEDCVARLAEWAETANVAIVESGGTVPPILNPKPQTKEMENV